MPIKLVEGLVLRFDSDAVNTIPSVYQQYYDYLIGLSDGSIEPQRRWEGLCRNFGEKFDVHLSVVVDFIYYPQFSGDKDYPLPGGGPRYEETDDMWTGEYGDDRRQFCAWCAEEIKREYST